MKTIITVERLKELVREFMILRQDVYEHAEEWAYVMLEPDLIQSREVTLAYLEQMTKEEFISFAENGFFDHILDKFESAAIYNVIEAQYENFFGTNRDDPFYLEYLKGLNNCVTKP